MSRTSTARRVFCVAMAWVMALMPMAIQLEQARAQTPTTPSPASTSSAHASPTASSGVELSYLPPDAFIAATAQPRAMLTAPGMELMPIEVISAAGKKEMGIDPLDIEWVIAFGVLEEKTEDGPGPPDGVGGVVLRLANEYSLDDLKGELTQRTEPAELDGHEYLKARSRHGASLMMPDERTLIIANELALRKVLAQRARLATGPLAKLMQRTSASGDAMVVMVLDPIREIIRQELDKAPVPPPFSGLKRVPELVDAAKLDMGGTGGTPLSLVILGVDEPSAEQLENIINAMIDMGHQMAMMQLASQERSDDPIERAAAQWGRRVGGKLVEMLRPKRDGRVLRVALDQPGGGQQAQMQTATIGILIALLLPAVQAAREAARRASSINNMKQLGLAMHNHHYAHRRFPARATFDDEGKPLLSWRVRLLPYVEESLLYDQFHLDEPWDSEHNRKLIGQMPDVYRNPSSTAEPGKTDYLGVQGEGMFFDDKEGRGIGDFTDGTSNTIMLVEVDDDHAVTWTKPEDWEYDAENPLRGLGHAHPGVFNVLFCDGSVRSMSESIDLEVFKAMLTCDGGEITRPREDW